MNDQVSWPGERLGDDAGGEVEIITTIPAPSRSPRTVARAELVTWCLQHGLPVPEPRRRPKRAGRR